MNRDEFEKIVEEGIEAIPKKFLKLLENVEICVADEPSQEQLKKLRPSPGNVLFGLYEGIPKTSRWSYSQALPDKITIFQKPIERFAPSEKAMKEMVKNTVWHEIAHHFGLDEKEVREAEKRRREK